MEEKIQHKFNGTLAQELLLKEFIAAGGHVYLYEGAPEFTEGVADDYSFLTEKLALIAGCAAAINFSSPITKARPRITLGLRANI